MNVQYSCKKLQHYLKPLMSYRQQIVGDTFIGAPCSPHHADNRALPLSDGQKVWHTHPYHITEKIRQNRPAVDDFWRSLFELWVKVWYGCCAIFVEILTFFRQPCTKHPADDVTLSNSPPTCSPLSPSITHSLFHSRLKTYLFHKSFPP